MPAIPPLPMCATASMMGLVAGLATRWAALPRLALFTIVLYAIPFCIAGMVADGGSFVAGAMQFLIVTTGTAALDRTSVVSGKSVSVRVDPGGRRRIKKKNTDANKL